MKKIIGLIILVLLIGSSYAQNLVWAKNIGNQSNNNAYSVSVDKSGNVYTLGTISNTLDLNPGAGTFTASAGYNYGVFILKTDSNGNFIWAKTIVGIDGFSSVGSHVIKLDTLGNIYITGCFKSMVDFDPGAPTYSVTSSNFGSNTDLFVEKLDSSGNFMWVKTVNKAASFGIRTGLEVFGLDNIYITGFFNGTIDFDPGSGVYNMTASPGPEIYILKLNSLGNFDWARHPGPLLTYSQCESAVDIEGNLYSIVGPKINKMDSTGTIIWSKIFPNPVFRGISVDVNKNVYVTGLFSNTIDFDPGPAVFNLTSSGVEDAFIAKLNVNGNLLWVKRMGGSASDLAHSLAVDAYENVYVCGVFGNTVDFDPGAGTYPLTSYGYQDCFIQKLNPAGSFIYAMQIKNGNPTGDGIELDQNGNIYIVGKFDGGGPVGTDFDPGVGTYYINAGGGTDIYFAKYSQSVCANLSLVIDTAVNVGCTHNGLLESHAVGGAIPYSYTWSTIPIVTTSSLALNDGGIYQVTVTDNNGCSTNSSVLISGPDTVSAFDLNSNLITQNFRPGFSTQVIVDAFNDGCLPVSGYLKVTFDTSLVIYNSSLPMPTYINNDTLAWSFSSLTYDSSHVKPHLQLTTKVTAAIGDTVCFNVLVTPFLNDANVVNNIKSYCFPVINGYDPNDKNVYPKGKCSNGYIQNTQKLTYIVRFQNTGNSNAININVVDSIDVDFNINTVRVIGSSHPLITKVTSGRVLNFVFNNINLPDKISNEQGSQGYVIFEIEPINTLVDGVIIKNKAEIYFDYNPEIITNVVLNTINDGILNTATNLNGTTITAAQAGAIYQWINCDNGNLSIPGAINQSFVPTQNGNYAVIVSDGCYSDTSSCVPFFSTSINELHTNNHFNVFPNPANTVITVQVNYPMQIEIVNILGEKLIEVNLLQNGNVDISKLNNGVYFIRSSKGQTVKFIKE